MRYIKTFEELDFSESSWLTTTDFLNMYYHCDNCDEIFKKFNKEVERCPHCECPKPDPISEDEYYKLLKNKVSVDEWNDIEKERIEDRDTIIDYRLLGLKDQEQNKKYYN